VDNQINNAKKKKDGKELKRLRSMVTTDVVPDINNELREDMIEAITQRNIKKRKCTHQLPSNGSPVEQLGNSAEPVQDLNTNTIRHFQPIEPPEIRGYPPLENSDAIFSGVARTAGLGFGPAQIDPGSIGLNQHFSQVSYATSFVEPIGNVGEMKQMGMAINADPNYEFERVATQGIPLPGNFDTIDVSMQYFPKCDTEVASNNFYAGGPNNYNSIIVNDRCEQAVGVVNTDNPGASNNFFESGPENINNFVWNQSENVSQRHHGVSAETDIEWDNWLSWSDLV
jgi:hypothetical protein